MFKPTTTTITGFLIAIIVGFSLLSIGSDLVLSFIAAWAVMMVFVFVDVRDYYENE